MSGLLSLGLCERIRALALARWPSGQTHVFYGAEHLRLAALRLFADTLADDITQIALSAFREGAARTRQDLASFCQVRMDEIEREAASAAAELAPKLDDYYPDPESAEMIVAHIGASTQAFQSVQYEIARLAARDEPAQSPRGDEG